MYAVLETGSKQYRVVAGDKIEVERLEVEAGQPFTFDRVLLVNNDGKLSVSSFDLTSTSDTRQCSSCNSKVSSNSPALRGMRTTATSSDSCACGRCALDAVRPLVILRVNRAR